jgi:hypothetical protein
VVVVAVVATTYYYFVLERTPASQPPNSDPPIMSLGARFTSRKCPPGPGAHATCQLPFGLLYSPFAGNGAADNSDDDVPVVPGPAWQDDETDGALPPGLLCLTCLAYINLYATLVDNHSNSNANNSKTKCLWDCALCGARNVASSAAWLAASPALAAPVYHVRQPLVRPADTSGNAATVIVLVVDANLPAADLVAVGRAVADLSARDSNARRIRWGLVVLDEAVAVYQLGKAAAAADGQVVVVAAADVLTSHQALTDAMLATQDYLTRSDDDDDDDTSMRMIQTCLAALAAGSDENRPLHNTTAAATTTSPPLSRFERLKRQKAARQQQPRPDDSIAAVSPWLAARQRQKESGKASRCTGEALQVAMDLATAERDSRTSRVWLFTNGCPNLGDGSVVLDSESSSSNNNNVDRVDALKMARAAEFYHVLAATALEAGLAVDVFCTGAAALGLPAYQALVEPSAGYVLTHESFTTPHLTQHLQHIWEQTFVSRRPNAVNALSSCLLDVRVSSFLTPTHFCGPGELVEDAEKVVLASERSAFAAGAALAAKSGLKTNHLPSRDMLETCLTRCRVGRVDPMSTFSFMFQLNDFFQKDSFCYFQCVARHVDRTGDHLITRVTTHRLPLAKDVGEFLDALDEDVVPVVLAKEAVYRSMHGREVAGQQSQEAPNEEQLEQLAYATQLDLDATVARISNDYRLLGLQEGQRGLDLTEEGGVRAAGSSLDFAFPPELAEALKRLYHLRRGPLLSPGPMRSSDDRLQLRSMFLRFPLEESLAIMAPSLWAVLDPVGPLHLRELPAETLALWSTAVIAADNYHSLFVWCGKGAAEYSNAKEYCQQFLEARSEHRFPVPDMHILADGDSMSRRFTAFLSPSHGDPVEHSLAHFPGLTSLPPNELTSLRSKFQFYDASTDPSFRSWFWGITRATSTSKDEGWSLCE